MILGKLDIHIWLWAENTVGLPFHTIHKNELKWIIDINTRGKL